MASSNPAMVGEWDMLLFLLLSGRDRSQVFHSASIDAQGLAGMLSITATGNGYFSSHMASIDIIVVRGWLCYCWWKYWFSSRPLLPAGSGRGREAAHKISPNTTVGTYYHLTPYPTSVTPLQQGSWGISSKPWRMVIKSSHLAVAGMDRDRATIFFYGVWLE